MVLGDLILDPFGGLGIHYQGGGEFPKPKARNRGGISSSVADSALRALNTYE